MKAKQFSLFWLAVALACSVLNASVASAGIVGTSQTLIASGSAFNNDGAVDVSVFNNTLVATGNEGTVTSMPNVLDYAFYNGERDADNNPATPEFDGDGTIQVPYASGSNPRIGRLFVNDAEGLNSDRRIDLWTGTDPTNGGLDPIFSNDDPDFEGTNSVPRQQTTMRLSDGDIRIGLGGLSTGTVYVLSGGFNNGSNVHTITAAFRDSSTGAVTADTVSTYDPNDFDGDRGFVVTAIDFDTSVSGFDQLTVNFENVGNSGSRTRFGGFVLTSTVPEPTSVVLLGLAGLCGLVTRRRAS